MAENSGYRELAHSEPYAHKEDGLTVTRSKAWVALGLLRKALRENGSSFLTPARLRAIPFCYEVAHFEISLPFARLE